MQRLAPDPDVYPLSFTLLRGLRHTLKASSPHTSQGPRASFTSLLSSLPCSQWNPITSVQKSGSAPQGVVSQQPRPPAMNRCGGRVGANPGCSNKCEHLFSRGASRRRGKTNCAAVWCCHLARAHRRWHQVPGGEGRQGNAQANSRGRTRGTR